MRRFTSWSLVLALALSIGCQKEVRDDDAPTSSQTSETSDTSNTSPDALATAKAWAGAEKRAALTEETRPIAESWKTAAVVLRIFREEQAYFALVGTDSSDRITPAILVKIETDERGWSVTETRVAASDFLWPTI